MCHKSKSKTIVGVCVCAREHVSACIGGIETHGLTVGRTNISNATAQVGLQLTLKKLDKMRKDFNLKLTEIKSNALVSSFFELFIIELGV